ncbi:MULTISPECIES: type II toxin-antitoxin system HicB family antitoxin [Pandoraea]|uniref:type II toxin-antitoxin system HicB family antitoxin n=1 Tax=Pandoraea TaxID=93217 RepID=UPI001F5D9F7C|nr:MULTISPECIES: type II toxin-antitoxin system HicB family antitoxin [Pandoraea]MCI3204609.1 CopG family transcriptional regulator [Pandoraea sp. LA3]MDN4582637.1 CopG family transcriptional regulator [Pandoraea capi]
MKYPIYVWQDEESAFGGVFPDLPGVHTAADTLDDLERNAQEAVELMYGDGDYVIPSPTHDLRKLRENEVDDGNGSWMFVDIDLSKVSNRAIRLNISLPERLVHQIDAAAEKRHMSRSAFLALAAQHEMMTA